MPLSRRRWFYWVYLTAVGVGMLVAVFECFDSRYNRLARMVNGWSTGKLLTDEFSITQVLTKAQAQAYLQTPRS